MGFGSKAFPDTCSTLDFFCLKELYNLITKKETALRIAQDNVGLKK